MRSEKVLWSKGKNDEVHTPGYAVNHIVKYIPPGSVVWCPFDTPDSAFVRILSQYFDVIHSHISEGRDFFSYTPPNWDVMVSNPPFTNKRQIFERALSFNKPFALIMSNTWLNDSAPKQLFFDRDLQLLMFDRRIDYQSTGKITFSSSYFCWDFLPKQIIMERLNRTV